jgi:outer membrane protein
MKKLLSTLLSLCLLASGAIAGPPKIGIVDMDRIYLNFYKTKVNNDELEKDKAAAKQEVEKRLKKFEALSKEFQEKQKTLSSASTQAAKQKAEQDARAKVAEMQSLRRDIEEFARRRQAQIVDKLNRMRKELIDELQKSVANLSKEQNYDLVFDKSGRSATTGVEFLLFSKDAIDFTDEVIKTVNKGSSTAAPSSAPTPAPEGEAPKGPKK